MSSNHKLERVSVQGYKSIRDQEILINDLNILIGQNGAGKSNFISLFKFLRHIIKGELQYTTRKSGGAENLLFYGSKVTRVINIYLEFPPNIYEIQLEPSSNDSLFIGSEECGFWNKKEFSEPYMERISISKDESRLAESAYRNPKANYVYSTLTSWRVYHFHDTSETAGIKKYSSLADNRFLFEDASNLASFLYLLRETEIKHYDRIVRTIQMVIPFFRDFVLRPNPLNPETIRLEWQDKFQDKTFTASELSDGSLRFICMATLLLQPEVPKILIIDEPELGLHPAAIKLLAALLQKAAYRSQVIVSTQSVTLVNEFKAEDIMVVEKEEDATIFKRLDLERLQEWLNDYSLGDLWEKNVLGGRP